jgi:hypothetical protein
MLPTRREFSKLITGTVCASVLDITTSPTPQKKDELGLAGQFGFSWSGGKLQMKAPEIHVAGMTIDRFTWGWVGLAVAASVIQEIGAAIFGAITNSLSQNSGPSIDEILKKQLEQISQIVGIALDNNRLLEAQNKLDAYTERLGYYLLECKRSVLQHLRDEIIGAKSTLSSLKFAGYGPYMVSTGLAQEQAKVGDGKLSDLRNVFHVMTEAAAKHHQGVQDQIDGELAITTLVTRTNGYPKWHRLSAANFNPICHSWCRLSFLPYRKARRNSMGTSRNQYRAFTR